MIAGVDLGSRTTKLVVFSDGEPCEWGLVPTGADPLAAAQSLLKGRTFESIISTGYGRHLAASNFADRVLTEIKACALGAYHLSPECRMVVDVGGQDSKAILLDGKGGFSDFAMNDRCAAGTGRFLEVIAATLGFGIEEFGEAALESVECASINSMCVVFAESEVTSLIARGVDRRHIARGIHQAVVERIASLVQSIVGASGSVLLTGGVALDPCIARMLEARLRLPVVVPERAQYVVALGAALSALDSHG